MGKINNKLEQIDRWIIALKHEILMIEKCIDHLYEEMEKIKTKEKKK